MASSVEAIEFRCDFATFSLFPLPGTRYTCVATVINSGSSSLENVTRVHREGLSNDDVGWLLIYNQLLPVVPEKIADFFGNLDVLLITESSLTTMSANDLRQFPRLVLLQLSFNQLTTIDGDLFAYTPHLQFVDFQSNQIQQIGHDLVTNLNVLTFLFFNANVCIDQSAQTRAEVILLAPKLSARCPPLHVTTSTTTSLEVTTTAIPGDKCPCDEEIEELREEVNQLIQENAAFEKRILEV